MPLVRKPGGSAKAPGMTTAEVQSGFRSADVDARWMAARAAPEVAGGAEALIVALRSEADPKVREAMLTSLARINSSASIAAVLELLRSDDASARTGALDTLRAMGSAMREHLLGLLTDADSDVRVLSCEIVRGLPAAEAARILCDLLTQERDVNVCGAAIDVLAEVGDSDALPVLAQCATRFRDTPFLAFAIQVATERIRAQSASPHV